MGLRLPARTLRGRGLLAEGLWLCSGGMLL